MNRRTKAFLGASLLALALVGSTGEAHGARGADTTADVDVTVNTGTVLGTIPSMAFGLNASAYDANLLDPIVPFLVRATGVSIMRYPGGSEADNYHWQNNSISPGNAPGQGGYANPNDTFDNFMSVVARSGAQAMITVNYGTNISGTAGGDPNEAAGWVQYANMGGPGYTGPVPTYPGASPTGHNYGITYWEIGNELYGNGTYGAHWEADLHPDALNGPLAYGQHALEFITAMKAVDPSIKVGVVLTAPGNWPDQEAGPTPAWNPTVLTTTCTGLDFVDVHWYPQDPGNESDATLLQSPENGNPGRSDSIPTMVAHLRNEINTYCPSRASQIQIMITETNSVSYNPGKQTVSLVNALFEDDSYMTWLENGVANVDWWQLHNGIVVPPAANIAPTLYGTANYGDYGVLSNGSSATYTSGNQTVTAQEPPADTPFPAYYGLLMLRALGRPGDQMVQSSSDNSLVTVHAVRQANGDLAVLLINKDPNASHTVALSLPGYTPAPGALVFTYGENGPSISATVGHGMPATRTQTVGPYSLTTILFRPLPPRHRR